MRAKRPKVVITMGDPSGVGPEIIAAALADEAIRGICSPLIIGDLGVISRGVRVAGVDLAVHRAEDGHPETNPQKKAIFVSPVSHLAEPEMIYGCPSSAGGDATYAAIVTAANMCIQGTAEAMATAPINKEALNRAGHSYPGHTELLAELTDTKNFVMMLAGSRLRVTLVTIHEALAEVPRLLTRQKVVDTIRVTHSDVAKYFRPQPRIAVLALNPHCGEGGLFGDEETRIIAPAVAEARRLGIDAVGPLSADSLFHFAAGGAYDAVVCMYHDQGLIPIKLLHFEDAVNVTLGLPIIRTSVDHGTAYDMAGTGRASAASMKAAIRMAAEMALRRLET